MPLIFAAYSAISTVSGNFYSSQSYEDPVQESVEEISGHPAAGHPLSEPGLQESSSYRKINWQGSYIANMSNPASHQSPDA